MFRVSLVRQIENPESPLDYQYKYVVVSGVPTTFDIDASIFSLLFQKGDFYNFSSVFGMRAGENFGGATLHHLIMGKVHSHCSTLMTDLSQAVWATKETADLQSQPDEYAKQQNVLAMAYLCQFIIVVTACLNDPTLAIEISHE